MVANYIIMFTCLIIVYWLVLICCSSLISVSGELMVVIECIIYIYNIIYNSMYVQIVKCFLLHAIINQPYVALV